MIEPSEKPRWTSGDRIAAAALIGAGAAGGFGAALAGAPMPFLIGGLIASASMALSLAARRGRVLVFPQAPRRVCVALIGAMIGSAFGPEVLALVPALWPSLCMVLFFTPMAHALGYGVLRGLGGYDRRTALFGSLPGGLIESITLGERAGCDVGVLTTQQFSRIVLVLLFVPLLLSLWLGEAVGSAAGQALSHSPADATDLAVLAALAFSGFFLGRWLRLPASQMLGPLLMSALAHATGLVQADSPTWLLNLAQAVIGVSLGALFGASPPLMLLRALALGVVAVGATLALGLGFALGLSAMVPLSLEALFISFAPGGVTEMGLIALSLQVSPLLVTTHHLARILLSVTISGMIVARLEAAALDSDATLRR